MRREHTNLAAYSAARHAPTRLRYSDGAPDPRANGRTAGAQWDRLVAGSADAGTPCRGARAIRRPIAGHADAAVNGSNPVGWNAKHATRSVATGHTPYGLHGLNQRQTVCPTASARRLMTGRGPDQ